MTRVAALYDVHGNLPALEAVLPEVPDDATIVIGGDVVAGGSHPAETLERLRALGDRALWLRGNGDRELVPSEPQHAPPGALDATRAALTEQQIAFLYALPPTQTLDVDGLGRVLFCHATPQNDMDLIATYTPDEQVGTLIGDVDADVVVCGHTHMQFDRVVGGVRIVNAGSVGMPFEDAPGAYWALLGPGVELRLTQYDGASKPRMSRSEATALFQRVHG